MENGIAMVDLGWQGDLDGSRRPDNMMDFGAFVSSISRACDSQKGARKTRLSVAQIVHPMGLSRISLAPRPASRAEGPRPAGQPSQLCSTLPSVCSAAAGGHRAGISKKSSRCKGTSKCSAASGSPIACLSRWRSLSPLLERGDRITPTSEACHLLLRLTLGASRPTAQILISRLLPGGTVVRPPGFVLHW
ncbi:hypothetical protein VTK26DRAFT_4842 [Humicola hyalothermophila]